MKRTLIFLAAIFLMAAAFLVWVFQRESGGVPILNYQQVNDIDVNSFTLTVEQFDAQMKYLADNGYNVITPDELLDSWENGRALPPKPVIITLDSGSVDTYKNIFPILKKYNFKATLFLVTDYVNLYPNYMTWNQAREMQTSGLIDVESHTLSHKVLTEVYSVDKLWDQIYGSKQAIEWYLKKPAKFIAYPHGKYTVEAEEMSKEVGYRAGFTIDYGLAHKEPQHYVLDRIPVYGANSHTFFRFKARLLGAPLIAPLNRFKNKLISDGNEMIADLIWIP